MEFILSGFAQHFKWAQKFRKPAQKRSIFKISIKISIRIKMIELINWSQIGEEAVLVIGGALAGFLFCYGWFDTINKLKKTKTEKLPKLSRLFLRLSGYQKHQT